MNQLIQELAEQAGYTEAYYESDHGAFIPSEFNKQKFAELIVLECMRLVGNKTCPNYAYKAIETHFGITQ